MTKLIWGFLYKLRKTAEFLRKKYSPILDNVFFCKVSKQKQKKHSDVKTYHSTLIIQTFILKNELRI